MSTTNRTSHSGEDDSDIDIDDLFTFEHDGDGMVEWEYFDQSGGISEVICAKLCVEIYHTLHENADEVARRVRDDITGVEPFDVDEELTLTPPDEREPVNRDSDGTGASSISEIDARSVRNKDMVHGHNLTLEEMIGQLKSDSDSDSDKGSGSGSDGGR